jgi:hypothetical protein
VSKLTGHATPGVPSEAFGMPTPPRHFVKRGCKLLKTKGRSAKKSGKRFQEAANC